MYAIKSGALFTLKCLMKTRPFTIIFGIYIASIPYFGYMLRIAERPMDRVNSSFSFNYQNSMWNVIITMTTGAVDFFDLHCSEHFISWLWRLLCPHIAWKDVNILCLYLGDNNHVTYGGYLN